MPTSIPGRLVIVGFGSLGKASLPLLAAPYRYDAEEVTIITAEEARCRPGFVGVGAGVTDRAFVLMPPEPRDNYTGSSTRSARARGDFSSSKSRSGGGGEPARARSTSCAAEKDVLYLEHCIEPWAGAGLYRPGPCAHQAKAHK